MDITGLQTFAPFNTMSQWGWHSSPLPAGQTVADFRGQIWQTHGRPIRYMMEDAAHPELSARMAGNPHRINLGRLGLELTKKDGTLAQVSDLKNPRQHLDLWHGIVTSDFELEGDHVRVTTASHPVLDALGVRIESPLAQAGRIAVFLACPGNDPLQFANFVGDWKHPGHFDLASNGPNPVDLTHRMDQDVYRASLSWAGASIEPQSSQRIVLRGNAPKLDLVCTFSPNELTQAVLNAEDVFAASRKAWPAFWNRGGAIDLSQSSDPRWKELERRIVLSQYLLKVNEAGSLPPQESVLVNNGWFGKFHMEMVLWHEAQWALWNRWPELEGSASFYQKQLQAAKERAADQGYAGARWPKALGPHGEEWPHVIHGTLIWQQPHPIFFAELDYRAHPTRATLEKWQPVVEATADFMASYAFKDPQTGRYVLGPPLTVVSENTDPHITQNPTFELGYWRFGLRTAQEWRKRLGLAPNATWAAVQNELSPHPEEAGLYVTYEGIPDMWGHFNFEHPGLTGAYGLLPGDGVSPTTMKRTMAKIEATWNFERTWGWDYPMLAMCAARLGSPSQAVDFLLTNSSGFQFDARGLATGGPFPYFPSNGALLYAVAMMAAGWDDAPKHHAPGFPSNWVVRSEGLNRAP
jgi:hypothetical protein